jgi:hypothetical protein
MKNKLIKIGFKLSAALAFSGVELSDYYLQVLPTPIPRKSGACSPRGETQFSAANCSVQDWKFEK